MIPLVKSLTVFSNSGQGKAWSGDNLLEFLLSPAVHSKFIVYEKDRQRRPQESLVQSRKVDIGMGPVVELGSMIPNPQGLHNRPIAIHLAGQGMRCGIYMKGLVE